jgi:hypothetical protein
VGREALYQGYSAESDLDVEVEGEIFPVHSAILMITSPVFRQMLTHRMSEASSRRIDLPGKRKDEFKVFWQVMQPFSDIEVSTDTALFLARWSDEYQVDALKAKCEKHLMAEAPITVDALMHAVECNLSERVAQCVCHLSEHMRARTISQLSAETPENVLSLLWPGICKAADMPQSMHSMPPVQYVRALWPFIDKAVRPAFIAAPAPCWRR